MAGLGLDDLYEEHGKQAELLPDAEYDFVVMSATHKVSQNGKDMFNCQCKVESGPYTNKTVWHRFVISRESDIAMQIFFRQMKALGLDGTFWKRNPGAEQVVAALSGQRFRGTTVVKEYQGNESNEIKAIRPPAGAAAVHRRRGENICREKVTSLLRFTAIQRLYELLNESSH